MFVSSKRKDQSSASPALAAKENAIGSRDSQNHDSDASCTSESIHHDL